MANPARRFPLRAVNTSTARPRPSGTEPESERDDTTLHLNPGDSLHVERAIHSNYDFVGANGYYMMAVDLSAKLPHMGLKATDYDVLHFLIGLLRPRRGPKGDLEGCTLRLTQDQIGEGLGIGRQEVGVSLRFFARWRILWHGHGWVTINPRAVFRGRSELQARAISRIPEDIPEIVLPDTRVRPPRRSRKLKGEG